MRRKHSSGQGISVFFLIGFLFILTSGCRSPFVTATITNQSGAAVSLIEVDYPSASFGVGSLAPGAEFHYRFKIQGSGPVKIQFTDATGKPHSASGPELKEKQEGPMTISIGPGYQASWDVHLLGTK